MAYKHVIRAKTKNLLSDISIPQSIVGISYDKQSGIFTIESNDKSSIGYSISVMNFVTPIPVGTVITVSIYCISGRYRATQGDNTAIGGYHKADSGSSNSWQGVVFLPSGTDLSGKTFTTTWTVTKPLDAFWIYAPKHTDIIEEDIRFKAQLELGSTPTPYTPYNYLQSNKRMIKVSDVCQLLDKSKYPASNNIAGVTYTNNGDGTWTVNGTSTGIAYSHNLIPDSKSYNLFGHKLLLMVACDDDNIVMEFKYIRKDGTGYGFVYYKEHIYTFTRIENYDSFQIRLMILKTGVTFTNTQAIPQLFDLTEMFGAGHEPATVAEFRQRFPNEYYPYSPQCWLTSYKSAVVCKTKNLFDVNNAVPYAFSTDNPDGNLIWLKDGIYTTRLNNYNIGSGLRIKDGWTLPAGVYTLSVKVVDSSDFGTGGYANIGFYYKIADGTWHVLNKPNYSYAPGTTLSFAINIPEHIELRLYLNYQNMNGQPRAGYVSYKDIQVEQGSTATSYVPYQHL